jgi:ribosome-associated toxin RatA of RatAB toxin-antitoxin module
MPVATHSAVITASIEEVMAVITDFKSYPDFLPEMVRSQVLSHEGNTWEVGFEVKIIRRLKYTLRLVQAGPDRLSWSLVEGAFRANSGSWHLSEEGNGIRADYRIDLQIGHFVPGNIVRSLVERTLPETVLRFKDETERRHPRD